MSNANEDDCTKNNSLRWVHFSDENLWALEIKCLQEYIETGLLYKRAMAEGPFQELLKRRTYRAQKFGNIIDGGGEVK